MLSISVTGELSVGAIPVNASSSVDCTLTPPATVNGAAAVPCAGMWIHNFSVEYTSDSAVDRTVAGVTPSPTTTSPNCRRRSPTTLSPSKVMAASP